MNAKFALLAASAAPSSLLVSGLVLLGLLVLLVDLPPLPLVLLGLGLRPVGVRPCRAGLRPVERLAGLAARLARLTGLRLRPLLAARPALLRRVVTGMVPWRSRRSSSTDDHDIFD